MSYTNSQGFTTYPKAIVIKKAPRSVVGQKYDRETPFSALFNSIYDAAIITDDEGRILDANAQAHLMLSYDADELRELNITNIIAGTNSDVLNMVCSNIDKEKHTLLEGKCVRGDRSSFQAEIAVGVERMPPANGPCFFIRDITQRKQAQNYLLTLKHAFQSAATGIVVTDLEGVILYSNPTFSEFVGCDPHVDVSGHHLQSIFSDVTLITDMMHKIEGTQPHTETFSAMEPDGSQIHLKITGTLNRDTSETVTGMVFIIEDITQQKQIALMKEQATMQRLDGAEIKARLETMTTLGYEFNNPLQSLLSMAEKDKRPEYKREISRLIEIVQRLHAGKELHKIVDEDGRIRYDLDFALPNSVPCKKRTILIAEDEKLIRDIFVQFLEISFDDITVECAADGQLALGKFFESHHGLIIMDSMMPVVNGEKAFDEIEAYCKLNNWQMPHILFCTGFVPTERITNIIGNGTQHALLPKPVRQAELVEVVDKFLD